MDTTRTPGRHTPGRRAHANKENVYFEPGKFGRKTGLTLKDTGIRDEHGFEPVSGIFSSPLRQSPAQPLTEKATRHSLNGPAGELLHPRRTPRLLPGKMQTPRHTNIGGSPVRSPARPSTIKPASPIRGGYDVTPTRRHSLPYPREDIMDSIERDGPQAGKSDGLTNASKARKSIFDVMTPDSSRDSVRLSSLPAEDIEELSQVLCTEDHIEATSEPHELHDSGTCLLDDEPLPLLEDVGDMSLASHMSTTNTSSNMKRKRQSARVSDATHMTIDPELLAMSSAEDGHSSNGLEVGSLTPGSQHSGTVSSAELSSIEDAEAVEDESAAAGPAKRGRKRKSVVHNSSQRSRKPTTTSSATATKKGHATAPKQARIVEPSSAAEEAEGSGSPVEDEANGTRCMGALRLRSATPFEDAGFKVTRSGRASIKPLAYWKNESIVWKHGEMDGVIRAHEVVADNRKKSSAANSRRRTRRGGAAAAAAAEGEEELHFDLLPEEWEAEQGSIRGPVCGWDDEAGAVEQGLQVEEDVAFSGAQIPLNDAGNGAFRYAKVVSNDFFGAGLVELPPGGKKRSKNSRAMAMSFFVHEGKATFCVGGMEFGVTAGGIVHVPRGNDYWIENESEVFAARIFFAQGCVVSKQ